jgi:hypothetical protein
MIVSGFKVINREVAVFDSNPVVIKSTAVCYAFCFCSGINQTVLSNCRLKKYNQTGGSKPYLPLRFSPGIAHAIIAT